MWNILYYFELFRTRDNGASIIYGITDPLVSSVVAQIQL